MSVVYGNAFGGIISENRSGTVSCYVPDTLGSTIGLMNSAGNLTDTWTYWPYGEVRTRTGSSVTPFTFIGMLGYFQDIASKLSYVRARHLRADIARWLTVDPLWPMKLPYCYTSNNPVSLVDPSGTDEFDSCLSLPPFSADRINCCKTALSICDAACDTNFNFCFGAALTFVGLCITACLMFSPEKLVCVRACIIAFSIIVADCIAYRALCKRGCDKREWECISGPIIHKIY